MTHTEKVHVYFGVGLVLLGLLALWAAARPRSFARTAWPVLAFTLGLLLFVPVESGSRRYDAVGWWATLFSWIPDEPGRWVSHWIDAARSTHAMQHKLGGALAMLMGIVELGVAQGCLRHARWRDLTPLLTVGVGIAFGVHGGSADHLSTASEQLHHRILGASFVAAGAVLLLHRRGVLTHPGWRCAWPMLMVLVGLDLILFYRLTGAATGHGPH